MNVEMFFVRSGSSDALETLVQNRIRAKPDALGSQPDFGLPSSYDVLLANEPKRRVALSQSADGWVAGIESKEVLDFALLRELATLLKTHVIAVQLSEVTGCCGYALCAEDGRVLESRFSEDDEDPAGTVMAFLVKHGVPWRLTTFGDAARMRTHGWKVVH